MAVRRTLVFSVLSALLVASCAGPGQQFGGGPKKPTEGDAIVVAAALYPIAEMVKTIGRAYIKVVNLTPPGTDAHGVELSAQQLEQLQQAKITFYLGENYQPAVQKSITSLKVPAVNLLDSLDLQTMTNDSHAHDEPNGTDSHSSAAKIHMSGLTLH